MAEEIFICSGGPSQVINTGAFILCGVLAIPTCGIALIYAAWRYLDVKNQRFELTTQRLTSHSGIFSKKIDEIELYRVKDTGLIEPFLLRLFGLGNVVLISSDSTNPFKTIPAVSGAKDLREKIRTLVEERRDQKRVRTLETE